MVLATRLQTAMHMPHARFKGRMRGKPMKAGNSPCGGDSHGRPGPLRRHGALHGAQGGSRRGQPYLCLSGRCGFASQHKVFGNTASSLGQPLFNTLFPVTNTKFALVTSGTVL